MNPEKFQFDLPQKLRPSYSPVPTHDYPGIEDLVGRRSSRRRYNPVKGIRAVVIHGTVCPDSKSSIQAMRDKESSFHFLIPGESEVAHEQFVWKVVPAELAAWHVKNSKSHKDVWNGKRKVNHWSIGIELVNTQEKSDPFSDWQVAVTAQVVRWCWVKYPNLEHVVSHAKMDPDRRSDPGAHFPWSSFKKSVLHSQSDPLPEEVLRAL